MLGKSLYYLTAEGGCKSSFTYTQTIGRGGNTQIIPTSFERKQTQRVNLRRENKYLSALLLTKHNKEINHEITFKHSFIQYDDEVGDEYP
jgi:hypothetical protein